METLVVNLLGSPSAGKSTTMADLFARLKWEGIDCEMASEFAKDLVWEDRQETLSDQLYIFAKQNRKLHRLKGKAQVIITDSPLLLSAFYNNKNFGISPKFNDLVLEKFNEYQNLNYYIHRQKKYNPNGRLQTEAESNQIGIELKEMLDKYGVEYKEINGTHESVMGIVEEIKGLLYRNEKSGRV